MNENSRTRETDEGLRRMLKWTLLALVLVVLLAFAVVEFTMRWFDSSR